MSNQPEPAPARGFAEETAEKIVTVDSDAVLLLRAEGVGELLLEHPDSDLAGFKAKLIAPQLRSFMAHCVRVGLRRAAEIAWVARGHPVDYMHGATESAMRSIIADAILRECGEGVVIQSDQK